MSIQELKGWAFLAVILFFCVTVWFLFLWGIGVINPQ